MHDRNGKTTDRLPKSSADDLLGLTPPNEPDAERAVLGSLLLDPGRIDDVAGLLRPEDFYADAHQRLYRNLLAMHDRNGRIDTALLLAQLKSAGDLGAVGGPAYLAEVAQSVPYAAHAAHYAKIVAKASKYRRTILVATAALQEAYTRSQEPEEILSQLEAGVNEAVAGGGDMSGEPVPIAHAVMEAIDRIDKIARREITAGLMTGFEAFDRNIGGLFAGELHVLAARPGVGKTALSCQIAEHVASRGRLVYHVTLEMSAAELATRIMCGQSGVDSRRVRGGTLTEDDQAVLAASGAALARSHWLLDQRVELTAPQIIRAARRLKPKGLELVIVDYLQIVQPEDRKVNRYEQVGQIAKRLKLAARELAVPVLCLCQLSREADGERPRLKHLRESGDVEQHADAVSFLYEPSPKDRIEESERTWDVSKNRNGPVGFTRLRWLPSRTRFESMETPVYATSAEAHAEFTDFSGEQQGGMF